MLRRFMRPISFLLIFSFLLLDFSVQTANAGMINTDTAITMAAPGSDRGQILAFLDRPEVQTTLIQQGIGAAEAKQRVASLSDTEVAKIARVMQQLPAGGDGVGAVVGAVVLVFVILLITDIMGLTHVFPFVRR